MTRAAPRGLAAAGKRFWKQVIAEFEPSVAEFALLEAACRQLDELARLEAVLAEAPVMVLGSTGQERAHPLFVEVRQHRAVLRQLLNALDLNESAEAVAGARSHEARRLALVRWHGPRKASNS